MSLKHPTSQLKGFIVCLLALPLLFSAAGCNPASPPIPIRNTQLATTTPTNDKPATSERTPEATKNDLPTASPTPVSTLDVSAGELRGALVHFWHPWTGSLGKTVQTLVEEFNLSNPWGIMVTPVAYSGYDVMGEALEAGLKTSAAPQVSVGFDHQLATWDSIQKLVDLQTYLANSEWGIPADEQADFYPAFWNQGSFDSRRIGMPVFRSAQVLFYNQTWGNELGFQVPPTTAEQFRQQVCAAAQANRSDGTPANDGTGGWIISTEYSSLLSWIYAFGGDPDFSPAPGVGESVYRFNSPEIDESFSFLRELFDSGCAWQSQSPVPDQAFAQRQGLIASGALLDIPFQAEALRSTGSQDQWTVLPYPPQGSDPAMTVYGPSFFILPTSPERQLAAWFFIRWMSAPENNARFVEASGGFPARASTLEYLAAYKSRNPQWAAALDLLQYARDEPAYASWAQVRRALGDSAIQLFRPYFSIDQIPVMLDYLDAFAAELHSGPDLQDIFATSTSAPKPGARPTRTPRPSLSPSSTLTSEPSKSPIGTRTGLPVSLSSATPAP